MNPTFLTFIEMAGTLVFAISGIRLAATKRFDLFGAYVVGLITAIGGGTIRDMMLGLTPFWLERGAFLVISAVALLVVIVLGQYLLYFKNTFFIFDTIGLALYTIVGYDKALGEGLPVWGAIILGMVTGSFGGVLRDMMVGNVPLLFRRDIYALASLAGACIFSGLSMLECSEAMQSLVAIASVIIIRIVSVYYHIHLPTLVESSEKDKPSHLEVHPIRKGSRRKSPPTKY